jgi:hypothetical protein
MLVFDTNHRPLLWWYNWLDENDMKLGRDYFWAVDPDTGRWAIKLTDHRQEIIIMLKSQGFIYQKDRKNEQKLDG